MIPAVHVRRKSPLSALASSRNPDLGAMPIPELAHGLAFFSGDIVLCESVEDDFGDLSTPTPGDIHSKGTLWPPHIPDW